MLQEVNHNAHIVYDCSMSQPLKIYVDQGVNLKKLRMFQKQGLVQLLQAESLEQQFKAVVKQGRAFTIGESIIGGSDMIAGNNVNDVRIEMGMANNKDFQHIYAAHLNRCDYFITENPQDFIANGKRQKLEDMLGVKIRRTDEFINELAEQ